MDNKWTKGKAANSDNFALGCFQIYSFIAANTDSFDVVAAMKTMARVEKLAGEQKYGEAGIVLSSLFSRNGKGKGFFLPMILMQADARSAKDVRPYGAFSVGAKRHAETPTNGCWPDNMLAA